MNDYSNSSIDSDGDGGVLVGGYQRATAFDEVSGRSADLNDALFDALLVDVSVDSGADCFENNHSAAVSCDANNIC